MRERILQFRKLAEAENARRERLRYSAALRQEAMAIFAARRREGASIDMVAAELGLSRASLDRWQARGGKPIAPVPFRQVEVVNDARLASPNLRLVTPRGFVIEGLPLTNLLALLPTL